jgi:hypothetical protein
VAQEVALHPAQEGVDPAITRPLLWALNSEIRREVWSLPHWVQSM